jgi:hypothetical protein
LVGALDDGTAMPMAGFVCLGGLLSITSQRGLAYWSRRRHRVDAAASTKTLAHQE